MFPYILFWYSTYIIAWADRICISLCNDIIDLPNLEKSRPSQSVSCFMIHDASDLESCVMYSVLSEWLISNLQSKKVESLVIPDRVVMVEAEWLESKASSHKLFFFFDQKKSSVC